MKKIKIIYLLALIILCSAVVKPAIDSEQSKIKTIKVNKGGKLIVEVNPGDIRIQTWDRDEVVIKVEGLDEDELRDLEVSVEKNTVSVSYNRGGEGEFNITVPQQFNLELKTTAGDISIKGNLDGSAVANSNGGDISCKEIKGNLSLETMGGNISSGNVDGDLDVSTMGGDVSIGEVKGKNVRINTNGGEINVKRSYSGILLKTNGGDITMGNAGGNSEFLTYGGNINIGEVSGSVNIETYGGDLSLKKAVGKVKAKTNGGNIELKNITGSVDAKTLAGEVNVELYPSSGSESRISTNSGGIELSVSSSAKVTIEARIHVQGWFKDAIDTCKIHSDFEAKSYSAEKSSRDIVGIYELNGGGSKIILKSVNDEIRIRRMSK
jgi:DUF4097 and DUF4098 domain-containing protein YvlB